MDMTSHRRWVGVARVVAVAMAVLVFGLAAFVNIQQRVLRWRAERLLADIRAIQMGKSTWSDAQRLMTRWGAWGMWDGSCTADSCEYQIALQDVSHATPVYFWTGRRSITRSEGRAYRDWELLLYALMGGRVTQVYGDLRVKDGIVWTKGFSVFAARDLAAGDFLIGSSEGTTRFSPEVDWESLRWHTEYSLRAAGPCDGCHDGACTICEMIEARFTPFTDIGVVDALTDFNLSCMTNWLRCNEPREIMPRAWSLLQKQYQEKTERGEDPHSCVYPLDVVGRDFKYASVSTIRTLSTSREDGNPLVWATLEPKDSLKGGAVPRFRHQELLGRPDSSLPGGEKVGDLRPGSEVIVLYDLQPDEPDIVEPLLDSCSLVSYSEQTLGVIRRGVARDVLSEPQ